MPKNKKLIGQNDYQKFYIESLPTYDKITYESNPGVVVMLSVTGGIFFVENNQRQTEKPSLELIRGFIENNETPKEAALREAQEELGIELAQKDIADIIEIGKIQPDTALTNQKIHIMLVQLKRNDHNYKLQESEGIINYHWIKSDDIKYYISNISDSLSLAAIAKLKIK